MIKCPKCRKKYESVEGNVMPICQSCEDKKAHSYTSQGLWVIVVLILVVGIFLVLGNQAKAQEERIVNTMVCYEFNDAKAFVDSETDKSEEESEALHKTLNNQGKCLFLMVRLPVISDTDYMAYFRQKENTIIGLYEVILRNAGTAYAHVHGTILLDEPESKSI